MQPPLQIIEDYKKQCEQLYRHFKSEAENNTALGSAKQRVRKTDIDAFAAIFEAFSTTMEVKALGLAKIYPEYDTQLTSVYAELMEKFARLGRQLTSRII